MTVQPTQTGRSPPWSHRSKVFHTSVRLRTLELGRLGIGHRPIATPSMGSTSDDPLAVGRAGRETRAPLLNLIMSSAILWTRALDENVLVWALKL